MTGFYLVNPDGKGYFSCACDQRTNGGGWTIIQRNFDRSISFELDWNHYKIGFGYPNGEFWLGNDLIRRSASLYTDLLIELKDNSTDIFEMSRVQIGLESNDYRLWTQKHLGKRSSHDNYCFTGARHYRFSTKKYGPQQGKINNNQFNGGFWYDSDFLCHLNVFNKLNAENTAYYVKSWKQNTQTEMKLRTLRGEIYDNAT